MDADMRVEWGAALVAPSPGNRDLGLFVGQRLQGLVDRWHAIPADEFVRELSIVERWA